MLRIRHLGAAVVLASIVATMLAWPASADVRVTVTPVHGRTFTSFAIKFTPAVRNQRYRNLILLTGPVGSRCRRPGAFPAASAPLVSGPLAREAGRRALGTVPQRFRDAERDCPLQLPRPLAMAHIRHLGAALGLLSIVAATGAAPASAQVPVTVAPVHGRTFTTFAVKFKPPVRSGRYRNGLYVKGPVPVERHHCRHRLRNELYTPGEKPPPPNRTLTWRFGPHAHTHVAANGDFSFRPQRTVGPLRRWCPGLYRGRLDVQRRETLVDPSGRLFTDWGRTRVFARFSFRVR
jgi:hypothetical protein